MANGQWRRAAWAIVLVVVGGCGSATSSAGDRGEGALGAAGTAQPVEPTPVAPPHAVAPERLDPDLAPWREALAAARGRQLERLARYAAAQRFPRNHVALGQVPVFVDPDGAHCAVAFLMRESGHGELVARIAREDVYVRIDEVSEGPLNDWILRSGLLREEAALIQPAYSWGTAEGDRRSFEIGRLVEHFARVDTLLRRTTEDSLTLALERLKPAIAEGATVDDVAR